MNEFVPMLFALVVIVVGVFCYFLPAFIAERRKHPNLAAIVALNALLGWTFLGWIAALVWALTVQPRSAV